MQSVSENVEAGQLLSVSGLPRVQCLTRQTNGAWTFHFDLDGEAVLPDGRRVVIRRRVAVRATEQIGRRRRAR